MIQAEKIKKRAEREERERERKQATTGKVTTTNYDEKMRQKKDLCAKLCMQSQQQQQITR